MCLFLSDSVSVGTKGLTGSNAAVAVAVGGVCECGWLRFLVLLSVLYDWDNV